MPALAEITQHIENVRQLRAVVGAMRGIAAARVQQSRALLAGIEAHEAIVARAIGEALLLAPSDWDRAPPAAPGRKALVLFCAEGGFCGGLSDRVLDTGLAARDGAAMIAIGARGATIAAERNIAFDETLSMATQIGAVPQTASRIVSALYAGIAEGRFLKAEMVYPRPGGGVAHVSLLPLDMRRFAPADTARHVPLTNLGWESLVERLAEEYVYALVLSAAMHSFVAENQARIAAMAAARDHIDTTLTELSVREHQARQEEITNEIVSLSAAVL